MGARPRSRWNPFHWDKHLRWIFLWIGGMMVFGLWVQTYLNHPALVDLESAFENSLVGGSLVVVFTLFLGWAGGVGLDYLEQSGKKKIFLGANFILGLFRSIPQIVGILLGYVIVTRLMLSGSLAGASGQILGTAVVISLVIFPDVVELVRQRIAYFRGLEFYDAMLCCGIPHWRIVNNEILLKNSFAHLMHKAVAVFGMAIFLQCSIDFIISVGLATEVSSTNFPVTLGTMLARMDSKQDILAIGALLTDPSYVHELLTRHLQGIGVAWTLVYTLLCTFNIANGIVDRYKL
jgi:ABC-type dipeptide/oligopeptide/nickel transport system permease subunit